LRDAAERLVAAGGPGALSVRAVADAVGTSTRAIYSVYGSKDGLVDALAEHAFGLLDSGLKDLPETADPAADLVEAGATMYRGFVREHPSLFRITFQRIVPGFILSPELLEARAQTWRRLEAKVRRLQEAGQLGSLSVNEAAVAFNALCEGLANAELRGGTMRALPPGEEERAWRDAFQSLVRGFAAEPA
jgi:AcrR family transcriptional regulator